MKVYIKSSEFGKDFDVFMLMCYEPDLSGESGMEGDRFSCLCKFYATDLASAKSELQQLISKYPEKDFSGVYVTEYNSYFDDDSESDPFGMPEVFVDLEAAVDACIGERIDSEEEHELPFDSRIDVADYQMSEEEYLKNILDEFTETLVIDPDIDVEDASYDIVGDTIKFTIIYNDGYVIDDWDEPISNIRLDSDRYVAFNYLMDKFNTFTKE